MRDAASNQLVSSIEIFSPVNKREPGLSRYRHKQRWLHQAGVHLLELDFIRRGTRPLAPHAPEAAYLISLIRAENNFAEAWPLGVSAALPPVPLPLRAPDADVDVPLAEIFTTIYDKAAYDLSVDYSQPPPPPALAGADGVWLEHSG